MKELKTGLTKGYLAFLDKLSLNVTGKISHVALSGQRKSGAKGSSMEFSDFREYTTGDDIRRIDWNSYARTNKLFTKLFMEEKQADINILLDGSKSMGLEEEKFFYSKMLAASLAYIGLKNNDKVNVFAFNSGVCNWNTNNSSRNKFPKIVEFLDTLEPKETTNIEKSVNEALQKSSTGITIIISDFLADSNIKQIINKLKFKKQQVILVQILGEMDINPKLMGNVRITDCEDKDFRDVTITEKMVGDYKKILLKKQTEIGETAKSAGALFYMGNVLMPIEELIKKIV